MGFLSVIRRWALRDKMPIREIARRTGLSRNTIKKYLREDAIEPKFKTPSRLLFGSFTNFAWMLLKSDVMPNGFSNGICGLVLSSQFGSHQSQENTFLFA